jgi:predicted Zn-dependent protease
VGLTLAFYLGDVSSLGAGLSAFLLEAKYSRDFEREADASAEAFLRAHAIPPAGLTALLARLDADRERDPLGAALPPHPLTRDRIRELEAP